jgi:zinc D-Ala-D-Ala carboxypeptidase
MHPGVHVPFGSRRWVRPLCIAVTLVTVAVVGGAVLESRRSAVATGAPLAAGRSARTVLAATLNRQRLEDPEAERSAMRAWESVEAQALRPSRSAERAQAVAATPKPGWLRRCGDGAADNARKHPNGRIPSGDLCRLPGGRHFLHKDAAHAWWRMTRALPKHLGRACMTDSYRSFAAQARLAASKPGLAAVPGRSNHGWGVATDLCGGAEDYDSRVHRWLLRNAPRFGWTSPTWARQSGSRPEPWHWEFVR